MLDTVSHRPQPAGINTRTVPAAVLFEPDIAPNVAATIRLVACLDVPLHVIEPCGFAWDPVRLRRITLDYAARATTVRHRSWAAFERWRGTRRVVALDVRAPAAHHEIAYRGDDLLLVGRESSGLPDEVVAAADLAVAVPIAAGCRSLNVVTALAIVLGEALRQTRRFPAAGAGVPRAGIASS